jgi:hypothetical protein
VSEPDPERKVPSLTLGVRKGGVTTGLDGSAFTFDITTGEIVREFRTVPTP